MMRLLLQYETLVKFVRDKNNRRINWNESEKGNGNENGEET